VTSEAFADSRFGSEAAARLKAAFEHSQNPMLIVDDEQRLVTANSAACEALGVTAEAIPWLTIEDLTPPGEIERIEEQWQALMTRGALEGWYPLRRPDGRTQTVEFSATANVLPGRHLSVWIDLDESSAELAGDLVPGEVAWTKGAAEPLGAPSLTERESEVLTLVASGLRGGDIAARLFVSPETVKSHVANAMGKLGAHTRAHAVTIALVSGQIVLDP
jgi:PAS domain S-box-containing protein